MTEFQNPMKNYCLTNKVEASGNITSAWKCWWYDSSGQRVFKSFACEKHGETRAMKLCIHHLREVTQ